MEPRGDGRVWVAAPARVPGTVWILEIVFRRDPFTEFVFHPHIPVDLHGARCATLRANQKEEKNGCKKEGKKPPGLHNTLLLES